MSLKARYKIYWSVLLCLILTQVFVHNLGAATSTVACFTPHNITATNQTSTSAELQWSDFSTPSDLLFYEVVTAEYGATPDFTIVDSAYQKSFIVTQLLAGHSYQFYIRSICNNGASNWSSGTTFHSNIINNQGCDSRLAIRDNACNSPDNFLVEVDQSEGILGVDLYIREVQLAIDHTWPADIEISLISPSGQEVVLLKDVGIGTQNIGNTNDPCLEPLRLDMDACGEIAQSDLPLIGSFRPMGDMSTFYDNTTADGVWIIKVCDDAQGQTGILTFAQIDFTETICSGPEDIYLNTILQTQASLIVPSANCDSIEILLVNLDSGIEKALYVNCTGDTITLDSLTSSTAYELAYTPMCDGNIFARSCPKSFTTTCDSVYNYTSFDNVDQCAISCDAPCTIDGLWTNYSDAQWLINQGPTSSTLTGPKADKLGGGNYVFIESSDTICKNMEAILLSSCLQVVKNGSCHLDFSYHMYGSDVTFLALEVSTDNMHTWDSLWMDVGSHDDIWNEANISLASYLDMNIHLRFRSEIPEGNFGDVAIDEIVLMGTKLKSDSEQLIYADLDNDGYGNVESSILFCGNALPPYFSYDHTDCDDNNPDINPGISESPCNLIDDDCDGSIDENQSDFDLDYQLVSQTDQNCKGVSDGSIIIQATGGTGPYSYIWMDGAEGNSRSDLSSGSYQAIVSDQSGCQILTDTFNIDILQQFDYYISSINEATCKGIYDGGITMLHDETNAPYTYLWSTGDTTKNIVNQTAGSYTLTITDVNGCLVVTNPMDLIAERTVEIITDSIHPISCFGDADGYIKISTNNEQGAVDYAWSTGIDTSFIGGLSAGTYMVQVVDSSQCVAEKSFDILDPNLLESTIVTNDPVICKGDKNGLLELKVSGGTMPYDVIWSNSTIGLTNKELAAGTYSVYVTDARNCLDSMTNIVVSQPDSLAIELITVEPALCSADKTGSILIDVEGGNGQYKYLWSDNVERDSFAELLSSGIYTVTVTDRFNCKTSIEDIGVPKLDIPLQVTVDNPQLPLCFGDDTGSLDIAVTNATVGPITFEINGNSLLFESTAYTFGNLVGGEYQILITDGNGCVSDTITTTLDQPDPLLLELTSKTANSCFADSLAYIEIKGTGGTGDLQYLWSNDSIGHSISSLKADSYSVTVSDASNCLDSLVNINIIDPSPFTIDTVLTSNADCGNVASGEIEIITNLGGTSPYLFASPQFADNDSGIYMGLDEGIYQFFVYDSFGCFADSLEIEILAPPSVELLLLDVQPSICNSDNGSVLVEATGGFGEFSYSWNTEEVEGAFAQNLPSGMYAVTITDENNCQDSILSIVVESELREIDLNLNYAEGVKCHNSANGIISSTLNGDFEIPISYSINGVPYPSQTEAEALISNLAPGTYKLLAIDSHACKDSITEILISAPPPIKSEITIIDALQCHNDSTGIIAITAEGGNGDLEYLWNTPGSGDTLFNLGAGTYTCAIIDAKNCVQFADTVKLINPDSLILMADVLSATNDNNNGAIYLQTSGGTSPYMFLWDPNLPTTVDTLENLGESEWLLTVVDANGCTIDTSFTITRVVGTNTMELPIVEVYPNPTASKITIQSITAIPKEIQLITYSGQIVETITSNTKSELVTMDLSNQPTGQYFLILFYEDFKLIKPIVKVE